MRIAVLLALAAAYALAGCSSGEIDTMGGSAANLPPEQQVLNAISEGDTAAVAQFLDANPQAINMPVFVGQTLLHQAVRFGQPAVVKLLLERGADPNARSDEGDTVLDYADENGASREIINLLEGRG